MKKNVIFFLFLFFTLGFLHFGCKFSGDQFTLTVLKGEGIGGFPESGTYLYEQNTTIFYNYFADGAVTNLMAFLDAGEISLNGMIIMNRNHELDVSGEKLDYNGKWYLTTVWDTFGVRGGKGCPELEDRKKDEWITIIHMDDSLSIELHFPVPMFPEGMVLTGKITGANNIDVNSEKKFLNYGSMTIIHYSIKGQFISSSEFVGILQYSNNRESENSEPYLVCYASASILGSKE